ncbi:MAG: ABC transporter substrate-binding protein [Cellulomonas sp.]|uniref:ABC transporter substrate-binding protein n=1 Tax=Cellulomonas sp. TaxID=40001 RepID=UPI0019DD5843|nr:ABC transporter substrate-binding protein [Cellulomonas sp.]MBF0688328.1 ABC transporter substrate-binding protein [Cellulomonas sp.]
MRKTSKTRSSLLAAATLALALTLSGCGGAQGAAEEPDAAATSSTPEAGGTLTVASPYPVESLDPHGPLGASSGTSFAAQAIFNRLVRVSPEGEVIPDLATEWTASEDAKEWTFTLRDATFSDGSPVTSADVAGSFERVLELGGPVSGNFAGVTIEATDDSTVVFTAANPEAALLGKLSLFFVTKGDVTEDSFTSPVGAGPFAVESFAPGEQMVLKPNEKFFGDVPILDELVVRNIPEVSSRVAALQAGEIQATWNLPDDQVPAIRDAGITVETIPATSVITMWFNSGRDALGSAEVRRALWQAIDFPTIISALFPQTGSPADSVVASAILGHAPQSPVEHDPDAAKAALEDAGFDFSQRLELQFSGADWRQFTAAVASDLNAIGVQAEAVEKESAVFTEDLLAMRWDINFQALSTPTFDAATNLGRLYTCAAGRNGYCNPELDELLAAAGSSSDLAVREAAYADAIEIIWDDAVGMYPMFMEIPYAWVDGVQGIELSGSFLPDFRGASVR